MPHEHTSGERLLGRDPLDEDVVHGYWTGTAETAGLDHGEFWRRLLAVIGPQAGSYWKLLDEKLATEAAPNHAFHVLGVYPRTRLLVTGRPEPVQVIDSCCIRHGKLGLEPTIYTGIESLFVSGLDEPEATTLADQLGEQVEKVNRRLASGS